MPIVMGGFSGGPGSRYQLVRTNYLIARLYPGNNYNDTGARNFLTLVNQILPNDLQADYLCLMDLSDGTGGSATGGTGVSFRDDTGVSPNIIELTGTSDNGTMRHVPLIGPNYPNLGANSGYTAFSGATGAAVAASADTMTRARDLMRKSNGVIQEVLSSAMVRLEITSTGGSFGPTFTARNMPLLSTDNSPLSLARSTLLASQISRGVLGTHSDAFAGSLLDIRHFVVENNSASGIAWTANRLSLNWRPDSSVLSTNFIPKGNAQERAPTSLDDVFAGLGSIGTVELTNGGTGYTGKVTLTGLTGSGSGVAGTVRYSNTAGGVIQAPVQAGMEAVDDLSADPGHSFAVGETITLTGAGNNNAVVTVTSVTNIFGFLSIVGIVDTHPPATDVSST